MSDSIAVQIAFILYIVSLAALIYVSLRSKNELVTSFGLIYGVYSMGFLQQKYIFEYFSATIKVAFSVEDYLRLLLLNFTLAAILVVSSRGPVHPPPQPAYQRILGWVFVGLGLFAMLNEIRYYGLSDFIFSDKALRFSGELGNINNLFIISIDYHLFILAGCYSLASVASRSSWRSFYYLAMLLTAVLGYLQGFRYYLAALFVFAFLGFIRNRFRLNLLIIASVIALGLFLAEASKITLSWILWYDWVEHYGYVNYFAMNYSGLIPQEVKAIATNTFLGFNVYADQLNPDLLGYLVKLVPFSERFYDFRSFENLYSVIGQNLGLSAGEGTAFSFFLDSYISYFLPVLLLWAVLWLTHIHPAPIVKMIALFFLLNLVRNGFLVSISVLKLPLLIYTIFYIGLAAAYAVSGYLAAQEKMEQHTTSVQYDL